MKKKDELLANSGVGGQPFHRFAVESGTIHRPPGRLMNDVDSIAGAEELIQNPIASDGADPWVLCREKNYYSCYSGNGKLWVNKSHKLQDVVQRSGKAIWEPESGKPYSEHIWAPELHYFDGKWVVYFAADDGRNENHRMYVLRAETDDPQGTYRFMGKIGSPSDKWAIDGTVLEMKSGKRYFIWSGWEGDIDIQQNLYIAPMSMPWMICGKRALISKPEHDWEKVGSPLVNEGPQVLKREERIFIIYSASGSWTDRYCLGQLTLVGDDPLNPKAWQKKSSPVFSATSGVFGPGHASFTLSPDGTEDWIVYHAAKHRGAGWNRNVRMQRFTWDMEGNPYFGCPVSEGVVMRAPSQHK